VTAVCKLFEGKKAAERLSSNFNSGSEVRVVRVIDTEEAATYSLGESLK
jgi:hypothetical protein